MYWLMNTIEERKAAMRQRTKAFASSVVRFYIGLDKRCEEQRVIGKQLLRSGTSVAAKSVDPIWQEADELIAIFVTMSKNAKAKTKAAG